MTKLYIAYGSNLSKRQMRIRCPTARPLGRFMLTKARLVFRVFADLEYDETSQVPCGLWAINRADEEALDRYEGVDAGAYFKSEDIVLTYAGRRRNALVYLMNNKGVWPPSQRYADTIRQGYKDFKLNDRYLDEALARSFDKQPNAELLERRARQRDGTRHQQLVSLSAAPPYDGFRRAK